MTSKEKMHPDELSVGKMNANISINEMSYFIIINYEQKPSTKGNR